MKKLHKIIIIVASALLVAGITYFVLNRNKEKIRKKKKGIILMGGLDNRSGDKSITEQQELLKLGVNDEVDIISFRYNDLNGVLNAISENPSYNIVLFSAGASKSKNVADKLKESGGELKQLYIVEPYAPSTTTTKSVNDAVNLGVPNKNVLVGTYKGSGLGIVENATPTPSCSPNHWCSLTEVGKIINKETFQNASGNNKIFRIAKSDIHGKGVIANKDLNPNEIIGDVILIKNGKRFSISNDLGKWINHQSYPNYNGELVKSGNKYILKTIDYIKKGEEIFVDYDQLPSFIAGSKKHYI